MQQMEAQGELQEYWNKVKDQRVALAGKTSIFLVATHRSFQNGAKPSVVECNNETAARLLAVGEHRQAEAKEIKEYLADLEERTVKAKQAEALRKQNVVVQLPPELIRAVSVPAADEPTKK